ncbi:MAG: sensor histidine kinase [Verrucomicrobia bacterium]|nr:MAG: sensor histidine kinase [Verrucomicrobiota bacterium]
MVLGAMAWMTQGVVAAEHFRIAAEVERNAAESRAFLEERTRLALWRMDAAGAAIISRENRMPIDFYQKPTEQPLQPEIRLYFEIDQYSALKSPQVLSNKSESLTNEMIQLKRHLLDNASPEDFWNQLNIAIQNEENAWNAIPKIEIEPPSKPANRQREDTYQKSSNIIERSKRAAAVQKSVENFSSGSPPTAELADLATVDHLADETSNEILDIGEMRSRWFGKELFLLRQIFDSQTQTNAKTPIAVQGVWLNRDALSQRLLEEIRDLLPHATLSPAEGQRAVDDPLIMVSFPFRLQRNEAIAQAAAVPFTVGLLLNIPLLVAWAAVILAVVATTLLAHGIIRLSERRASFVSAVTHELRTPLTTFRLYSDMLESGAVKPEKRGDYLRVLSREADRLSHLVENVLAFSRIERGNARSNVCTISVSELLDQSRERLEARLATAGMTLHMDGLLDLQVRVDTAATEHILFNLIDNAAKYASQGQPPMVTIQIDTKSNSKSIFLLIRDHGPGIAESERFRIFRAFHKSARDAAETRPGVGLGLALSRRLAREQGGDLTCQAPSQPNNGAVFILQLPAA